MLNLPRNYETYLKDILESIRKIESYTIDISIVGFRQNELVQDAVTRNLEIIGEAVKIIPEEIKNKNKNIEWKKIAGLRDILAHAYFGIDIEIIWDIIENEIPILKNNIKQLLSN